MMTVTSTHQQAMDLAEQGYSHKRALAAQTHWDPSVARGKFREAALLELRAATEAIEGAAKAAETSNPLDAMTWRNSFHWLLIGAHTLAVLSEDDDTFRKTEEALLQALRFR